MAKYAISLEGVQSLRTLAKELQQSINTIFDVNKSLQTSIKGMMDELGIYGIEIWGISLRVKRHLEDISENIGILAQVLNNKANEIDGLINDILGTFSSQNNEISGDSTEQVQTVFSEQNSDMASYSRAFISMVRSLEAVNVSYRTIELSVEPRTTEEIVERLSGDDLTEGSCSSLAFAYIGNKGGYDVLDFRGGESCVFFSLRDSIRKIISLPGVKSTIINGMDDIDCASRLLNEMIPGKEYYLGSGGHASIVRRNGANFEYLELQHPSGGNGWNNLDINILKTRFSCLRLRSCESSNFLIDVDSMLVSQEFLNILGYINTACAEQRKEVSGNV